MTYTVGSLFSGIGGLDLGFERAGFEVRWFCEADGFCRKVLAKHWPGVPCYEDVRAIHGDVADAEKSGCGGWPVDVSGRALCATGAEKGGESESGRVAQTAGGRGEGEHGLADTAELREGQGREPSSRPDAVGLGDETGDASGRTGTQAERVDVLIGGFPCQDVSHAGKRAGLDGARSGLWSEFGRLIGELRPRVAVMENVPGLFTLGFDTVLGDLAALGYDAEWATLRASDVGAPHRRERVFIVAYPEAVGCERSGGTWRRRAGSADGSAGREGLADAAESGPQGHKSESGEGAVHGWATGPTRWPARPGEAQYEWEPARVVYSSKARRGQDEQGRGSARRTSVCGPSEGADDGGSSCASRPEPALGGVLDGLPPGLPRWRRSALQALGNAVVPQVAEIVARRVKEILDAQPHD